MKTPAELQKEQKIAIEGLSQAFPGGETAMLPLESISKGIGAAKALIDFIKLILFYLARAIIAPCEILLRFHFGERYFNPLIFGLVQALLLFTYRMNLANGTVVAWLSIITSLGVGVNKVLCFLRDRRGEYWHSYSEGISRIRVQKLDEIFAGWYFTFDLSKIFFEPALLIVIGGLFASFAFSGDIWFFDQPAVTLSIYFLTAGGALLLYQVSLWRDRRDESLNEKDTHLNAEAKFVARRPVEKPNVQNHRGLAYIPASRAWPGQAIRPQENAPNPPISPSLSRGIDIPKVNAPGPQPTAATSRNTPPPNNPIPQASTYDSSIKPVTVSNTPWIGNQNKVTLESLSSTPPAHGKTRSQLYSSSRLSHAPIILPDANPPDFPDSGLNQEVPVVNKPADIAPPPVNSNFSTDETKLGATAHTSQPLRAVSLDLHPVPAMPLAEIEEFAELVSIEREIDPYRILVEAFRKRADPLTSQASLTGFEAAVIKAIEVGCSVDSLIKQLSESQPTTLPEIEAIKGNAQKIKERIEAAKLELVSLKEKLQFYDQIRQHEAELVEAKKIIEENIRLRPPVYTTAESVTIKFDSTTVPSSAPSQSRDDASKVPASASHESVPNHDQAFTAPVIEPPSEFPTRKPKTRKKP